jgi:DNA recombination-dependent growth factor C
MTTTVRIPLRLEQALAQYCTETRRSKSEVIIELLEQRFAAKQPEKTAYEIACETGFIGSLTAAEDMAGNAKRSIRNAIARKHGRA